MRARGTGSVYRRGRIWWLKYYADGSPRYESSGSRNVCDAQRLLKLRLGQIAYGRLLSPISERLLVRDLSELLLRDYRVNGKRGLAWVLRNWKKHLVPFFGAMRAASLSTTAFDRYVDFRRSEGAANATINRELANLRRILSLAASSDPPLLQRVPHFPRLKENAPRSGFVTPEKYAALQAAADALWLRAALALLYAYGFRKSEIFGMKVSQVDLNGGTLRLNPGATKSGEGRIVKLTGAARYLVAACCEGKRAEDFLLTWPNGKPIRDFRETWYKLTERAGCSDVILHDFRRTAAMNLRRAGVPENVIMRIGGWKTRSVFDRYNIIEEGDLLRASEAIEKFQNGYK